MGIQEKCMFVSVEAATCAANMPELKEEIDLCIHIHACRRRWKYRQGESRWKEK